MQGKVIVLLCLFFSTSLARADFFSMGPRVGINISHVGINSFSDNTTTAARLEKIHHWGYHVGIFTRFNLLLCYAQPEALFTSFNAKFKENNKILKLSCTKLDIPLMVGLSLLRVFRVQLGPVFHSLLSTNAESGCGNVAIGWQAGIGVDIWRIVVDLKYEGRGSKFDEKITNVSTDYGYAPWVLSIGFNIL